jgi:serine/threonine protein kinase
MTTWNDQGQDVLDDLIQQLEQAWQLAGTADLAQFVPAPDHPERQTTLVVLIQTDQELRWQRGQAKTTEEYLAEWPELRDRPESVAELSESEARLRLESRLGRYEIRTELGHGGMGTVYRAFDTQLEREVALKLPNCDPQREPAVVARFLQEGKAAARIQHPHVCPIYDAGCVGGTYFLVMALIEGESLTQRIRQRPLAPEDASQLIRKLAAALQVVHEQGIVHRDIKPSNVMVTPQGEPLLMDFGLARRLDDANRQTVSGMLVGTIPYMSPEQVNGEPADRRSDVYSLGVVFYELLAGQLPFQGKLTDLLLQIGQAEPVRPSRWRPGLNPQLEAVCLKAMAKRPEDRYQSAAELAAALQENPTQRKTPPSRSRRRSITVWLAGLVALAVVAVLPALWQRPASPPGWTVVPPPPVDRAEPRILGFTVELQRRDDRGPSRPLSPSAFPLRDGDRVQFHVSLTAKAYVYMYWFDHAGQPLRLYPPPGVSLAEQWKTDQVMVPRGAYAGAYSEWMSLRDMRGAETVFVGVSDEPRLEADLRQLESSYQVPSRLGPGVRLAVFSHPEAEAGPVRGLGEFVISPKDTPHPLGDFEQLLREQFAEYRGWILVND